MRIGVFGATGQVGNVMRTLLDERGFPVDEIRYFASARSAGSTLPWKNEEIEVEDTATADFAGLDVALFSNGGSTSKIWAPRVAEAGAVVVDNSSAWRKDPEVPLVVSEVNPEDLDEIPKGIVANPNCTTMAAMPVLKPLHDLAGPGAPPRQQLPGGLRLRRRRPHRARRPAAWRVRRRRPQGPRTRRLRAHPARPADLCRAGRLQRRSAGRFTRRRRLARDRRGAEAAQRVAQDPAPPRPAGVGHLRARARVLGPQPGRPCRVRRRHQPRRGARCAAQGAGVVVTDVPNPLMATGRDDVYVGRVRADQAAPEGKGLVFFVVGDNLRKGAALNAVQIAEELLKRR